MNSRRKSFVNSGLDYLDILTNIKKMSIVKMHTSVAEQLNHVPKLKPKHLSSLPSPMVLSNRKTMQKIHLDELALDEVIQEYVYFNIG
jgi:hypothetical protein